MPTGPQKHLNKDKILKKIIARVKLEERKPHNRYFESLCVAIINQQLSGKAAATIEKKFVALFGKKFPKPEAVLKKSDAKLRTAGLSFQKIKYIKGLAKALERGSVDFKNLEKMSDENIIAKLVELKGIGRWTAEMFLMFALARPDVFSHGDLGLRNAIMKWYGLDQDRHKKKYYQLIQSWSPHRTLAARYLWASLEKK